MPISVSCGSCGKKLKAPDSLAGKRVKCPGCGKSLTVAASRPEMPAAPPPVDDDNPFGSMYAPGTAAAAAHQEEQTGEPQFPGSRPAWSRVRTGLNLLRFGVVFRLLVTLAMIAWLAVAFVADKPFFTEVDKEGKIAHWGKLGTDATRPAMNMLAMPLTILGLMLAVAAPMTRGAKLFALLGLFLALFMFFLYCPGNVGILVFDVARLDAPRLEKAIPYLNLAAVAGAAAEFMMFFVCILYLRACGAVFNQKVGVASLLLMGFFWITLACGVGAFVVVSMGNVTTLKEPEEVLGEFRQLGSLPLIASIALNVLGLFWFVHYFITISKVRGIILRNLFRLAPE